MRYHIDTIPVWDAFRQDSECPLCDLYKKSEAEYLDSFLGASVMEPDVRLEVNRKGFCAKHFSMMLPMKNRLGLALVTHTHLKEVMQGEPETLPRRGGLFSRRSAPQEPQRETCIVCDRLENTMNRYLFTTLHLFENDGEFRSVFLASKGLCIPHARALTRMAGENLSAEKAEAFCRQLNALQKRNLERVEQELFWFTQKFDYRNADKPWGNAKDSPERAILKLRGRV